MNYIQKLLTRLFKRGQKTSMITLVKCPKCNSFDTDRCHHHATFALPECYYQRCNECEHQWDFN